MKMELQVTPSTLSSTAMEDVSLRLSLKNDGLFAQTVFCGNALYHVAAGWVGPWWDVAFRQDGVERPERFRELRTYYGPPGMPPSDDAFTPMILRSGEVRTHTLFACWIPASQLSPSQLTYEALDPEGMDGVRALSLEQLRGAGVLLFSRTLLSVEQARQAGRDVLRPGTVLFVPTEGAWSLQIGYREAGRGRIWSNLTVQSNVVPLGLR